MMKFGTELVLEGGRFLGGEGVQAGTPTPPLGYRVHKGVWGASGVSTMHFGKKLLGAPDLVGAGHLFGTQIQIWSHGHSP